ncbi:hypothetical protein G6O69_01430 [Pseudenhygromyxa sp. WMMC2535]|uniref:hypothetical protein n=1 Tax=Pseudenhygromyxa sp. WMMC2535 TaxID=2712867 RepID=UPI00155375A1|nr:hypothetical protein [Pseudenhygromyxa sp. WMMC2535]NVB36474.1 hypothetical protein [Pseudenhygromyxa sp. WMMC2535]
MRVDQDFMIRARGLGSRLGLGVFMVLAGGLSAACADPSGADEDEAGSEIGSEIGEDGSETDAGAEGETETGTDTGEPLPWPSVDLDALPYEQLSEYGFFVGETLRELEPAAGVFPYTVVSPLFSDFAGKARFLHLPEGAALHVDWEAASPGPGGEGELWEWPEGSVVIKNFYFDLDRSDPGKDENARLIETRLLVRFPEGWEVYTYVWDEGESDAVLTKYGQLIEVAFTDTEGVAATQEYKVPSLEQCGSCHARDNELYTLGPVSPQMNYLVERDGEMVNQMQWLADQGLFDEALPALDDYPTMVDPLGESGTLDERARSYLHANCSHCHRQDGGAGISGLRYPYWESASVHLGICKPPAAAGAASGGRPYDIVPGDPDQSIVVYRMESLDPMVKMPELPSRVLNPDGIALISEWITAMDPAGCD